MLADILNDLTGGDDSLAEAAVQSLAELPEEEQLAAIAALRSGWRHQKSTGAGGLRGRWLSYPSRRRITC